ncbi:hypothetical protein [Streptomyces sp. NPDC088789]|uniref:hypothetical protein n=1 Tax=Streptomyces sp. NPDC088789 TaxID=3365899 RepID=UPI0038128634
MTMGYYVSLTCNVEDTEVGPCMSEDTGAGAPQSATEVRRILRRQGWHRTRDGRDICPDCWSNGKR